MEQSIQVTNDVAVSWYLDYVENYNENKLIKAFGEPRKGSGKVRMEWAFNYLEDGEVKCQFTLYDWKGDRWHVGGTDESEKYLDRIIPLLVSIIEKQ